jgi:Ca-activated chloride channel homolog
MTTALLAVLPFLVGFDWLQSKNRDAEQGNAAMKAGKAEEALGAYDRAAGKLGNDPALRFDRGTALYALSRYEEAAQEFLRATEAKDGSLKASAFYNLGNAFAKANKFKEAIEAYKRSLALDPRDQKAKANLELAQRQLKEEEKKKQQQDDKNKKDDQKNDEKKDQDKKDQSKKDDKKDQQKKDDQKDDKKDDQKNAQNQPQPQPEQKPPEAKPADDKEIGAVLDSLEHSPKDLEKERARLRAVRRRPPAKDW